MRRLKIEYFTEKRTIEGYSGILYRTITSNSEDKVFSILPKNERNKFRMNIMKINAGIPPHTDSYIRTTINFYIKPENYVTKFYDVKNINPRTHQIQNQKEGSIFHPNDLTFVEMFCAKRDEIWALDVTKPHSVTPLDRGKERLAVVLGTQLPYNDVCELLRSNNQID